MTGQARARAHEVLSVPSRIAILDRLRACAEPMDAHRVAAQVGLHVTTVRFHLSALIDVGLVTEHSERTGGRGRPRTVYSASWTAEPESGPYQELAELLAAHLADTPALRAQRAEQVGAEWARQRLRSFPSAAGAPDAQAALTMLFTEMGFDPEQAGDGRILLHACPFRATAQAHPEVVCGAHRALLRAALARLDPGAPAPDLHAFVRPDLCVITAPGSRPVPEGR
ncbi:metalloregulator ArsR/SmtB family transcription factor [Microbispora sp. H13382]|uniref:helix-turn-helix transcriptional regulator n=1 Tax=Microbispora sp. H13382 TaxID=2729112 RepID=UPI0016025852|nr:helix-turn-helix domain-containing protein [Microbispora sp. H13382]